MYDELGIGNLIDQMTYQDEDKRIVSLGQAVKAMVLNGLGFTNQTLYLMPHFFEDKPVKRLFGNGIEAKHLNDDVMGRALDKLYTIGVTRTYTIVAAQAVQRLGLTCRFGHLDATGFHLSVQYNSDDVPEEGVVQITKGYSRDHRPDINQVVLQLISERQAGIPLLMEPLNGNNSDKESDQKTIQNHIGQLRLDFKLEYVASNPNHVAANQLLTEILLTQNKISEAHELLEKLYEYQPDIARTQLIQTLLALAQSSCDSSDKIKFYKQVLTLNPEQLETKNELQKCEQLEAKNKSRVYWLTSQHYGADYDDLGEGTISL
jgi:tetratricopeptide (TPR) repeat protein